MKTFTDEVLESIEKHPVLHDVSVQLESLFCLVVFLFVCANYPQLLSFNLIAAVVLIGVYVLITSLSNKILYSVMTKKAEAGFNNYVKFMEPARSIDRFFLHGFEDALFVAPILLCPYPAIALVISTTIFCVTHFGGTAKMLSVIYLVPIAYLVASHYGLLTTIVAHGVFNSCLVAKDMLYQYKYEKKEKERQLKLPF